MILSLLWREHGSRGARRADLSRLYAPALAILLALAPLRAAAAAQETLLVAYGDSLSAGFGLEAENAFPARLEAALRERGHNVRVTGASVSGDTTAAGLARLEWSLPDDADGAILELGANDALRGIDPGEAKDNLDAIISKLKAEGVEVLLAGMMAPRNLGPEYTEKFDAMYPELAERHDVLLYPFFLDGVAGNSALNQGDGMHPNAKGAAVIVDNILPYVEKLLARIAAAREDTSEQ